MVGADIVIASVSSSGDVSVGDYYSTTFAEPETDVSMGGSDDVEMISGSQVGGVTSIEFRRKIDTGDKYDRPIKTKGETDIIFAWHSTSDVLIYHG